MKELTIEEKAKRYDEAIETARKLNNGEGVPAPPNWTAYEVMFPELKESEDDRIRKALIDIVNARCELYKGITKEMFLVWLEKQGEPAELSEEEQNKFAKGVLTSCALSFIDYLDAHKYEGKMCVSNGECEDIENAFRNAMWDRLHRYYCKYIEKQGEQKPAEWSDEDEKMFVNLVAFLECIGGSPVGCTKAFAEWLKERYKYALPLPHWKPSDEQIGALEHFVRSIGESGFASPYNSNTKLVYSLLSELKKLRG